MSKFRVMVEVIVPDPQQGEMVPDVSTLVGETLQQSGKFEDAHVTGTHHVADDFDDEFECEGCGSVFDIEDSFRFNGELLCHTCYKMEAGI